MHTIRLRGPWGYQVLSCFGAATDNVRTPDLESAAGRVHMPADWGESLGHDFRGRVKYERRFHRPTGLTDEKKVYITFSAVDGFGETTLNGSPLGQLAGNRPNQRFDVTALLQPVNKLSVVIELPLDHAETGPLPRPPGRENAPGGLIGEVRLEIEDR